MSHILVPMALILGAGTAFWRSVHMIDRMGRFTCAPVAWSWIAMGVTSFWVVCAALTGLHLLEAIGAFTVSVGAVLATDRRMGVRPRQRRA